MEENFQEPIQGLHIGAATLGLQLNQRQAEQLECYCELILEENQRVNLTAVRSEEGVMQTLFLDSLTLFLAAPDRLARGLLVDVGSGSGIPGIALKIASPDLSLVLVESVGKKARFLDRAVRELGLKEVEVLNARAEEAVRDTRLRDAADTVTARAVASVPSLIELCAPFARPGGVLLFPKTDRALSEVAAATRAAAALKVQERTTVSVPRDIGVGSSRVILVYEKTAPTPSGYPRRVGLATTRPL